MFIIYFSHKAVTKIIIFYAQKRTILVKLTIWSRKSYLKFIKIYNFYVKNKENDEICNVSSVTSTKKVKIFLILTIKHSKMAHLPYSTTIPGQLNSNLPNLQYTNRPILLSHPIHTHQTQSLGDTITRAPRRPSQWRASGVSIGRPFSRGLYISQPSRAPRVSPQPGRCARDSFSSSAHRNALTGREREKVTASSRGFSLCLCG